MPEAAARSRGPRVTVPFANDAEYLAVTRKAAAESLSVAAYLRDVGLAAELSPNARVIRELIGLASRIEAQYAPEQPQYLREYAQMLVAITDAIGRLAMASPVPA